MKANNLQELSTEDKILRSISHNLCLKYQIPIHLSDDFLSDSYLKVNNSYFKKNKYVTIGGMYQIINSVILDYLKSSHTKKTIITKDDDILFINAEQLPVDYEAEILNDIIYENRIEAVTSLNEEDIATILLTVQTSFRVASVHTDKSIHYLRKNKARILTLLRSITN